jgi:hypothetical protein
VSASADAPDAEEAKTRASSTQVVPVNVVEIGM